MPFRAGGCFGESDREVCWPLLELKYYIEGLERENKHEGERYAEVEQCNHVL
jgi:hypothetical protein